MRVVGATAAVRHARTGRGQHTAWSDGRSAPGLGALLTPKPCVVALANKTVRTAWTLVTSGEAYTPAPAQPKPAAA